VAFITLTFLVSLLDSSQKMNIIRCFIFPAVIFQASIPFIKPDYFHLIGGFFDLLVVLLLARFFRSGWLVLTLAAISTFSIFANYYGWVMYESGRSAQSYDSIFLAIYIFVFVISLMEWLGNDRAPRYNSLVRRNRNISH